MVIKGRSRKDAVQAGSYLLNKNKNEKARLIETKGTISQNVKTALREMEALAGGTRCKKFLYHASITPKKDEFLTPEQWERAVDLLEEKQGLKDHQRIVVEHTKEDGSVHHHILWNRIDPD